MSSNNEKSSSQNFSYESPVQIANDRKQVTFVQFGVLSAEQWRALAEAKLEKFYVKDGAVEKTVYDPRMGPLKGKCITCGMMANECFGHQGVIELEKAMWNPEYFEDVISILKCICLECCALRLSKDAAEFSGILSVTGKQRLILFKKRCETIDMCGRCEEPLPKIYSEGWKIYYFYKDKKVSDLITPTIAHGKLSLISDEDFSLLGFNNNLSPNPKYIIDGVHAHRIRPESFIFTVLPPVSIATRPWVVRKDKRKDDDLTNIYNEIVKINETLKADRTGIVKVQTKRKKKDLTEKEREKKIEDLQNNVNILFCSEYRNKKVTAAITRQKNGLKNRAEHKEGHFQSNVGGKRSDFTARTVIASGGTYIRMGYVGISQFFQKTQTIPIPVLALNIKFLQKLMKEGKINAFVKENKILWVRSRDEILKIGDIVERQLLDGVDWSLINRQPTLRMESMQGMKVQVSPNPMEFVKRLPLGVTRAYNADFDGDEIVGIGRVHS